MFHDWNYIAIISLVAWNTNTYNHLHLIKFSLISKLSIKEPLFFMDDNLHPYHR